MLILLRLNLFCFFIFIGGCSSLSPEIRSQTIPAPQSNQSIQQQIPKKTTNNSLSNGPTITVKASLGVKVDNHKQKSGAYVIDFDSTDGKSPAEIDCAIINELLNKMQASR